ncbi:MAG: carbon storage regulator CsrA [Deltaproteobacteria bacterium]|nr:carbon storage regulator CsrA [Deltaproteobacteria bacterium]MBW1795342.1 carbon storage regulator CsrA [Deltaproteobacteria bacterium]
MLVLTRKLDEKINIGDDIILTVLEIGRTSVKLGIDAPKRVGIFREELYERIKEENLMSSQGTPADVEKASRLLREKGL